MKKISKSMGQEHENIVGTPLGKKRQAFSEKSKERMTFP
jgi:hypothetical protein